MSPSIRVANANLRKPRRGHPYEAKLALSGQELRSIARAVDAGRTVHLRGTLAKTARGQSVALTIVGALS